ncbi:MAG: hypothetical protein VX980_01990, partial [Actinomycetota bacterium]|nr:hypothetical protein [Actinomycetota bacterium]
VVAMVRRPRREPGNEGSGGEDPDDEMMGNWFDVAAAGPDGDRRLDRWVARRVAGPVSDGQPADASSGGLLTEEDEPC